MMEQGRRCALRLVTDPDLLRSLIGEAVLLALPPLLTGWKPRGPARFLHDPQCFGIGQVERLTNI